MSGNLVPSMVGIKEIWVNEISGIGEFGWGDIVPGHAAVIGTDDILFRNPPSKDLIQHFDIEDTRRFDQWGVNFAGRGVSCGATADCEAA